MVTYNLDIPDGPNNPSNDQPKMKTNTNAIQTLISVDHVGFNTDGSAPNGVGGHHLQVSFDGKNAPLAQTDPQSVLYTTSGTASTNAELNFRNQNGIYRVSTHKAFGVFTTTAVNGAVALDNGINVVSITRTGGNYAVVLTAGAITGTTVIIFLNHSNNASTTWTYALDTLTISTSTSAGAKVSFAILQV